MNEIEKFHNARKTTLEMIQDRNYLVNDDDINMDLETFKMFKQNNDLDLYYQHSDGKLNPIYIRFYITKKKLSENEIKKEVNSISSKTGYGEEYNNNPNVIFVTLEKSNQNVYNLVKGDRFRNVEIFIISELLFNPSRHVLVNKHEKLSKEQEKELMDLYSITKTNLPKIPSNDKQIRYNGLKPGDVCKIIRKSEVTGFTLEFKLVR
jgi:DNA-directed RNA polymerases I, II, and III subunit RPABC1